MTNDDADSMLSGIAGQFEAGCLMPLFHPYHGMRALSAALVFAGSLPVDGLPFQARSRADRASVDALRRQGLLESSGATSGCFVRLAAAGMAACWNMGKAVEVLAAINALPTVQTPHKTRIVMGCELCRSAGDWWEKCRKSQAAWREYRSELASVADGLTPLLVAGWVRLTLSVDQTAWAVSVTPEAATATAAEKPDNFRFDQAAYAAGAAEGRRRFATPPDAGSVVAALLPCSKWYGDRNDR